jgi:outer membrane protein assembly factor BamB
MGGLLMSRKPNLLRAVLVQFIVLSLSILAIFCTPVIYGARQGEDILDKIDVKKGICVLLDDHRCELALKLARDTDLLIYVQLSKTKQVEEARRMVDEAGLYGTRIWVESGAYSQINLADNLADVLVVSNAGGKISEKEILRVLHPKGKAILGDRTLIKPVPKGIDEWRHPYHGPDNNPYSTDRISRAPYLTQFLGDPRYAPLPQVAVSSGGRLFKAFGHIAFKPREEPFLNTLAAFDAYNGTLLWKRPLVPGIMVHRNTLIATPGKLYVGDDKSCKILDAATGDLLDEVKPDEGLDVGTFWKWMALEGDVLYALVGEQEKRDPDVKLRWEGHGWPWNPLSEGFNQEKNPWGYGKNLLAIDTRTKKVLWHKKEAEDIDSRALCMKDGRIYIFRFDEYLACIDAKTGEDIWRKTKKKDPGLFEAIGTDLNRQDWRTNWRTTNYLKCSKKALYFAGPSVGKLLAVSAEDGRILWEHAYSNYQIVLCDDGLYGISGEIDKEPSRKFDPLTGKILDEFSIHRRACARVTASGDAVFFRASGGSVRMDERKGRAELVSPMRAQCHDGVMVANGLLYWWPSTCDCNLTLYGITSLAPAGEFDFYTKAKKSERLEKGSAEVKGTKLEAGESDWPTYRADNSGSATTQAVVAVKVRKLWDVAPDTKFTPTAPVTVDELVFIGGSDGIVRAINTSDGSAQWKAYTGGAIRMPPTIWEGRALVGSGDGYVYNLAARTGETLWRFRAAPKRRTIPVYNSFLSTWPVGSGVLVDDGVAYFAAGIVNYDGTYVYAVDAENGKIKWQNNRSGHLDPEARTGVSVQGQMLLHKDKLYMAGGNAVSPGVYNIRNGKCFNSSDQVRQVTSQCPRGRELYLVGDAVLPAGKPLYAHDDYPVYDDTVFNKMLVASMGDFDILWSNNNKISCYGRVKKNRTDVYLPAWGKFEVEGLKPVWEFYREGSVAFAVCKNAVIAADSKELFALDIKDGKTLWTQPLPAAPVAWGVAVNRHGQILITLEGGRVLCFAEEN